MKKSRFTETAAMPTPPTRINKHLNMDFVSDLLTTGQFFRALRVNNHYSRECLLLEVGVDLPPAKVTATLDRTMRAKGQVQLPGF